MKKNVWDIFSGAKAGFKIRSAIKFQIFISVYITYHKFYQWLWALNSQCMFYNKTLIYHLCHHCCHCTHADIKKKKKYQNLQNRCKWLGRKCKTKTNHSLTSRNGCFRVRVRAIVHPTRLATFRILNSKSGKLHIMQSLLRAQHQFFLMHYFEECCLTNTFHGTEILLHGKSWTAMSQRTTLKS